MPRIMVDVRSAGFAGAMQGRPALRRRLPSRGRTVRASAETSCAPVASSPSVPLAACAPVALNTTIGDRPEVRRAMVESVEFGVTADDEFVLRAGPPLPAGEGGRAHELHLPQHPAERELRDRGLRTTAIAAEAPVDRDGGLPAGPSAPRVPGYGFDRIEPVHPSRLLRAGDAAGRAAQFGRAGDGGSGTYK